MSYLALARKYRPCRFREVVGQDHVIRTLENAIELDRVHHAYLFTGARGVGKTTVARLLAAALNAENGASIAPPADDSLCIDIAQGRCPDVVEIDGASNNGVDSVRELRETVRYLPSRARYKLYIIDEVHMLSQAAFNALLKTLEEPPAHVKFIFATTEPHKIPATILSRCQRFDFRTVSLGALVEHLDSVLVRERLSLGEHVTTTIAREAKGSVRDALSLLDQTLSYVGDGVGDDEVIEALGFVSMRSLTTIVRAVAERDADSLLRAIEELETRGYDLPYVAGLLVEYTRDLLVLKTTKKPEQVLLGRSPGELVTLRELVEHFEVGQLHRIFALLVNTADSVSRSSFPRVQFEMGLLRLFEVEPAQRVTDVLRRLDTLLKQKASSPSSQGGADDTESSVISKARGARDSRAAPHRPISRQVGPHSVQQALHESDVLAAQPDLMATWGQFVAQVRAKHPIVSSLLAHAQVLAFGSDGVRFGFAAGEFYAESLRERDNWDVLQRALKERFGSTVGLEMVSLDESVPTQTVSLAEQTERNEEDRQKQVHDEAVNHPAVQDALSILGGELKEVQPIDKPNS